MGRIGAFLIHLGISAVIFAVLAALVVFVWYPDFFFGSDGGWQGIRLILLVDLVLGPLLTLIVFNRRKPWRELRRDLGVIGVVQVICLVAGTYVVYDQRPLALVYVDGQFFSMSADDYRESGQPVPDLSEFPGPMPKRLVVDLPDDVIGQADIRSRAIAAGSPLRALAEYYRPMNIVAMDLGQEALDESWLQTREEDSGDISRWLAEHGGSQEDYAFVPFGARYRYLVAGIDRRNAEIVGFLAHPYSTSGEAF